MILRSTPKTQPFELLLLYLFESNSLQSINLYSALVKNLDIA